MLQNTIEIAEHVQPPECGCTAHVLLSSKATGLGVEAKLANQMLLLHAHQTYCRGEDFNMSNM
jgi:hypothetical protein